MKPPLYRESFKASFFFALKNKQLLVFGLLAALLGQVGITSFFTRIIDISVTDKMSKVLLFPNFFFAEDSFFLSLWGMLALLILFGVGFFLLWAGSASQGAIMHAVAKSSTRSKTPDPKDAWEVGRSKAFPVLWVHFLEKFALWLLILAFGFFLFNLSNHFSWFLFLLYLIVFILVAALSFYFSLLSFYTKAYMVVENKEFKEALKLANQLFFNHLLVSFELAFLLFLCEIVFLFVAIWLVSLVFLPTLFVWFFAIVSLSSALWSFASIIAVILATLAVVLLGSLFTLWVLSAWTYLFVKMSKQGIMSRVLLAFKK